MYTQLISDLHINTNLKIYFLSQLFIALPGEKKPQKWTQLTSLKT